MNKWILALAAMLLLGGCVTASNMIDRADEHKPIDPQKAIVVGFVSEGFLTQPHGLNVLLKYHDPAPQAKATRMAPSPLNQPTKFVAPRISWATPSFTKYLRAPMKSPTGTTVFMMGSVPIRKTLVFSVEPGDAVYIGNFHANSLTMCLSNRDDFAKAVIDIKKAHPFLANVAITNLSHDLQFPGQYKGHGCVWKRAV